MSMMKQEITLHSPMTREDFDIVTDHDMEVTAAVIFDTYRSGHVRFIKEEMVFDFVDQVLTALQDINYALWEIDIPSPTVPEYIEHHQQVQGVMKLVEEKLMEIRKSAEGMKE